MALKIIIPVVLGLFSMLFSLACIGEKVYRNKVLYAAMAVILFFMTVAATAN